MSVVLDASALLAYLRDEPGADVVADALDAEVPAVSTVNWIEVAQRVSDPRVLAELASMLEIVPLERAVAEEAAALLARTRALGLSLADRSCLALARTRRVDVLTADQAWSAADVDVVVRLIR